MNKKTLEAHRKSIRHWERMRDGKRRKMMGAFKGPTLESIGPHHCALCRLFFWQEDECLGCPVSEATGRMHCQGTPYDEADDARDDYGIDSPEFKEVAAKEVEFLKSLLPEDES